ncbi:MAG TPA: DMT family transporter, partial [Candidatus Babeliales bacterium]|nr:DMT family transporter [Candidatus Babeliales bacterium]
MLIIFVLYALMALTFSIGQQALQLVPPVWLIGFRMTLAGLLLLGYLYFFKPAQLKLQPRDLGQFLKVTFLHAYLPFVTEFWALQYLSAPKAALLFNLTPVVTALLAYFTQRERLVWPQILGLAIGVLGFMPVLWELAPQELLAGQFFKISLPELALLISVISSAYAWLTVQKLVQQNYTPVFVNGVAMLGSGLLAFFTSEILEPSWSVLTWSEFNPGPSLSWAEF